MDAKLKEVLKTATTSANENALLADLVLASALMAGIAIQLRAAAFACLLLDKPWYSTDVLPSQDAYAIAELFADDEEDEPEEPTPEDSCMFLLFVAEAVTGELMP